MSKKGGGEIARNVNTKLCLQAEGSKARGQQAPPQANRANHQGLVPTPPPPRWGRPLWGTWGQHRRHFACGSWVGGWVGGCPIAPPSPVGVGHLWVCGFSKNLWWVTAWEQAAANCSSSGLSCMLLIVRRSPVMKVSLGTVHEADAKRSNAVN